MGVLVMKPALYPSMAESGADMYLLLSGDGYLAVGKGMIAAGF